MAFDNLNYSTANMDNDSLQDQIDQLQDNVKNNLTSIKNQVLSQQKNVKIDIKHSSSYLKVRNKKWEIQAKQWKDNERVQVLKDHIFGPNQKIFLHVCFNDGTKWYISADYVKPVNKQEVPPVNLRTEDNVANTIPTQQDNGKISLNKTKRTFTTDKKEKYNRGPDGASEIEVPTTNWLNTKIHKLLKENPETATQLQSRLNNLNIIYNTFLPIWLETAEKKASNESFQWMGDWANDSEEIRESMKKIQNFDLFSPLFTGNINKFDAEFNKFFLLIMSAERHDSSGIMDIEDIQNIQQILRSNKSIQEKKYLILNTMRSGWFWESGNSESVWNVLMSDIMQQNKTLKQDIEATLNSINIEKRKTIPKEFQDDFSKARRELNRLEDDGKIDSDQKNALLEIETKKVILKGKILSHISTLNIGELGDTDPRKILGNIYGVWEWSDWIADSTAEGITERVLFLATTLVPWMGLSMVAMKIGGWLMNLALKWEKAQKILTAQTKLWTAARATKFGWYVAVEWTAFHTGIMGWSNFKNATEWNDLDLGTQADLAKSFLFAGVYRWVNSAFAKFGGESKFLSNFWKVWDDGVYVFDNYGAKVLMTTTFDAMGIAGWSYVIDNMLSDDRTQYTMDHILENIAMAAMGRLLWGNRLDNLSDISFKRKSEVIENKDIKIVNQYKNSQNNGHYGVDEAGLLYKKWENGGWVAFEKNGVHLSAQPWTFDSLIDVEKSIQLKPNTKYTTKNWSKSNSDTYTFKTDENGDIVYVYNQTKGKEIKGGAKKTWIKHRLDTLKKEHCGTPKYQQVEGEDVEIQKLPDGQKTNLVERNNAISRYEESRFKEYLKIHFKWKNGESLVLQKENGESLKIYKTNSWKYTIGESNKLLSLSQASKKIDSSFKIDFLDKKISDQIAKMWEWEIVKLDKTYGLPWTEKIKITQGEVELKGNLLEPKEAKKIFKQTKMRQELLAKRLDKMSTQELWSKMKEVKWVEEMKNISLDSIVFAKQRLWALIKSWVIGGSFWALVEVFFREDKEAEISDRALDVLYNFCLWGAWWVALSIWKTWMLAVFGSSKTWVKILSNTTGATFNAIKWHKWKILLWVWWAAIWSYVLLDDDNKKSTP